MYFKRHDVKQKSNISSPYLARTSKRLRDQLNFNSSYHLETEGPTLKVNQILKNVVQVCFLKFHGKWENNLPLKEFSHNNRYHSTDKTASLEAYMSKSVEVLVLEWHRWTIDIRLKTEPRKYWNNKEIWKHILTAQSQTGICIYIYIYVCVCVCVCGYI